MIIDILGWLALVFVLPSAWFQIFKNFQGKSVDGVSFLMFFSLFVGLGLFFVVSLFRVTPLPTTIQFGLGTLAAAIVLWQMFWYRTKKKGEKVE